MIEALYNPVSNYKMKRGEGIFLYDDKGFDYIDCASATFNLSLGYSHPAVLEAMQDQANKLVHVTSSFQTEPVNKLAAELVKVAPAEIKKAHLKVSSGSAANEGAVKMVQRATGARDIITMFRSHHGQTNLTASISGNAFRRKGLENVYPNLIVPDPYCKRCFYGSSESRCKMLCVDRIEQFIEYASRGDVAAVMIEPISGNGGNIIPPDGYFTKLQRFCKERGIKIIMDEIQTGIGRTGYMFASEYFNIDPDIITIAKGLGGSGAQIAAILTTDEMSGLPASEHSFTYGSNSMAAAAAIATLQIISEPSFLENVRRTGSYIKNRLESSLAEHPNIFDIRGLGLMIGVEISDKNGEKLPDLTNRLAEKAMDYHLILRTSQYGRGNVLKIRPPLITTIEEAELICERFEKLIMEECK